MSILSSLPRALIAFSLFLAAAGTNLRAETLRIGTQGSLASLDPHVLNETFSLGILSNVMEGLVRRDAELRLQPALATNWQQLSPLRWRFHLRRGVTFHDGSPFSADDVIFSFKRAHGPKSQQQTRIPKGLRVEKIDRYTVDFHLAAPNPILHIDWEALLIMSSRWARRHKLERAGDTWQRPVDVNSPRGERSVATARHGMTPANWLQANGTGPYRVTHHLAGEKTLFARNAHWWGGQKSGFALIEMHTVRNDQTRTAALLSGQVDLIVPAPLPDLKRIDRMPDTKTVTGPELRIIYLNMDQMRDTLVGAAPGTPNPLRDRRVRRAIYHAIDADAIARVIMRGRAVVATSLMSPLVHSGVRTISRLAYDPDRARALLSEADYPDGFTLPMDCPSDRYINDAAICEAIAGMLGRIGIRVPLNIQTKSLFFAKVLSGGGYNSAFNLIGWTPGALDGSSVLSHVALCRDAKGNGARFNLGGYCNRKVDQLVSSLSTESNRSRRAKNLTEALKLIHDDVGFIPLHQQTLAWAMSNRIAASARADNQIRFSLIRPAPRM